MPLVFRLEKTQNNIYLITNTKKYKTMNTEITNEKVEKQAAVTSSENLAGIGTITSKHLRDKDNHTSCECGNKTIYEYSWTDHNGDSTSCPSCMVSWQSEQIKALKELLYELSSKSKEETSKAINQKYAEFIGVDLEYLEDMGTDYSTV